jgi:AbrB family looped-hinge helix DNA binding protein
MASQLTVMTRKGQITIPVEIRRALDLKEGDKVEVTLENGHARLSPYGSVVARTAGALRGPEPARSAEEEREAFERGVAEEVVASMGE